MFDFFIGNKDLKRLVNAKTSKKRRVFAFFLTIAYIAMTWVTTHLCLTTDLITLNNVDYPISTLYKWALVCITVLTMSALIVGNAITFPILLATQIIEIVVNIISFLILRADYCVQNIIFYFGGICLIIILRVYIYKSKLNEANLDSIAYCDTLTKCINRRGLIKLMEDKTIIDNPFFLVFLDLDNFKAVNDTLGHKSGDELLKFVASKWSDIKAFDNCTLARLGGDEFALLIDSSDKDVARKVVEEMFQSIKSGNELAAYVTSSAGIASYPHDTRDIEKLLSYADTAMYKAKTSGKNRYLFFSARMYKEIVDRYNIEKQIQHALEYDQFYLLYQPQYIIGNDMPLGYETLIRMKTPNADILPNDFINIAEQSSLIFDIDLWVIKHALMETKELIKKHEDLIIAVNLSGKHLCDTNIISSIMKILNEVDFPAKNLEFEITESSYIKRMDDAALNIYKLKKLGCKIALDDFGTGYSSLRFLTQLQIDIVKIDRSFTNNVCSDPEKLKFINIIVQLAHLLKCKVIAEGVETAEQIDKLSELGVDIMQGYYWGKPLRMSDNIQNLEAAEK